MVSAECSFTVERVVAQNVNRIRLEECIMKLVVKAVIIIVLMSAVLLVWAPWVTYDFAVNRVVEYLGGPDARFHYLNQDMAVKDVPKQVDWWPFGRFVTFPGEAGWFVSFYGSVS